MRFLLDTHSFLWYITGDDRTSGRTRDLITDAENDVLLSTASLWKIAIKTNIGKLTLAMPFPELIPEQLVLNSIEIASITLDDLATVSQLTLHHRDPFDRLIIAQALVRSLPIVGKDRQFTRYGVDLLW